MMPFGAHMGIILGNLESFRTKGKAQLKTKKNQFPDYSGPKNKKKT